MATGCIMAEVTPLSSRCWPLCSPLLPFSSTLLPRLLERGARAERPSSTGFLLLFFSLFLDFLVFWSCSLICLGILLTCSRCSSSSSSMASFTSFSSSLLSSSCRAAPLESSSSSRDTEVGVEAGREVGRNWPRCLTGFTGTNLA